MNSELQRKNPVHVLTYRTTDPDPQYLQVYVLSNLTSNTWTLAPAAGQPVHDGKLPVTPGLSRGTPTSPETTRITLAKGLTTGAGKASFLPLPYPARTVSVNGDWRTDPRTLTMFSGQNLSGLSYTVTSREVSPSRTAARAVRRDPEQHRHQLPQRPGGLPAAEQAGPADHPGADHALRRSGGPAALVHPSRQVHLQPRRARAGHGQGAGQLPDQGPAGLLPAVRFRHGRAGPAAGHPLPGGGGVHGRSPIGHDRWDVRTSDAHAWPELYFQGAGWLRFEPTPSGSDGQATAIQPAYTLPPQITTPGGTQACRPRRPRSRASAKQADSGALAKLGTSAPGEAAGGASASRSGPIWLIIVAVIAVLLITPRLARSLTRRRRWSRAAGDGPRAQAAWLELLDNLTDYKVAWSASESPRALGTRLTRTLRLSPEAAAALARIVHATERARYARDPADSATLRADTDLVRRTVSAHSAGWSAGGRG